MRNIYIYTFRSPCLVLFPYRPESLVFGNESLSLSVSKVLHSQQFFFCNISFFPQYLPSPVKVQNMTELIREAPLGQIIRWVTRNRVLQYPEELPGFELPETYNSILNSPDPEKHSIASRTASRQRTQERAKEQTRRSSKSSDTGTVDTADEAELEKKDTERQPGPYEQADIENLGLSRTRSRLETTPYTEDRLEVEAELALERTQTKPIVPIKTSDGKILVDWYTTDDPANPQNWSNGKRALVSFVLCLYTFVVYTGSSIYTSSIP